ncbi:hypothetical protein [Krasilnikovia sp. MM14-A1259]|uniref:hypothetical protein n=1 Tax=Krasilnikovia sp. MM14-A1259 TaxID=3373539 RepID=UPI00399CB5A3
MKDSSRRNTSLQWPAEVDAHLDYLVRLAASQGVVISRAQMLAALVSDASVNAATVAASALRYLGSCREGDLARREAGAAQLPTVRYRGRRRSQPS